MSKLGKLVKQTKKYSIYVSKKVPKKYVAIVNGKRVYFGDSRYKQYFDKLGYYSNLNHKDKKRKKLYYLRHGKATKYSPKWFSHKFLW